MFVETDNGGVSRMIDLNQLEKYRENNRIEAKKAVGGLQLSWKNDVIVTFLKG